MEQMLANARAYLLEQMATIHRYRLAGFPDQGALYQMAVARRHRAADRVAELQAMVNPTI